METYYDMMGDNSKGAYKDIDGDWKEYDKQPPSPQSSVGVEEKKVDKNSIRLILKKHQVVEVIDDSFVHGTFPIEFIIAAMIEYSSLMNKEKDEKIEYWKQRCEAAEKLTPIFIPADENEAATYQIWQSLKNQKQ